MVWVQDVGDTIRLFKAVVAKRDLHLYRELANQKVRDVAVTVYLYAGLRWAEHCDAWHEKPDEGPWTCGFCAAPLRSA